MTKAEKEERYLIIFNIGKLFKRKCRICDAKCNKPKAGFTIHHIAYKNGEKTYSDFKNEKGLYDDKTRLAYYKYLEPIVRKERKRFAFICKGCHYSTESFVRYGDKKIKRLLKIRKETRSAAARLKIELNQLEAREIERIET